MEEQAVAAPLDPPGRFVFLLFVPRRVSRRLVANRPGAKHPVPAGNEPGPEGGAGIHPVVVVFPRNECVGIEEVSGRGGPPTFPPIPSNAFMLLMPSLWKASR